METQKAFLHSYTRESLIERTREITFHIVDLVASSNILESPEEEVDYTLKVINALKAKDYSKEQ
ncbi:MAG: hypothetical protein ACE5KT_02340 [Methanosarcinales archaeon]